ncbi:MAG: hypothetical protein HY684_07190 [Chloroflexi bacterium]|nr:hypothetical protein [Chloroflexota bacterium]
MAWRRLQATGVLLALALLVAACNSAGAPASHASETATARPEVVLASLEHVVGRSRVSFVVLDEKGTPVMEGAAHVRFFQVSGANAALRSEADAAYRDIGLEEVPGHAHQQFSSHDLEVKGVWLTQATFDRPGPWGVEVRLDRPGKPALTAGVQFDVLATPTTPAVGAPAPRSRNLIASDVKDLSEITTARPPGDMYRVRIADAIAAHRPLLALFATPAYCTSRVCGPVYEIVQTLQPRFAQDMDFVHIEIWKDPVKRIPLETVTEWGLQSEPWVFLIDRNGVIRYKFNGLVTVAELEDAIQRTLAIR